MRILKYLAIVAAAATLAGCGGGGGGGTAATGSTAPTVNLSADFWTIPSAPTTTPVGNITTTGNMAFRFVESNGGAQTVQATVRYTTPTSLVTFAPLIDNDRLVVTQNLSGTTATLNDRSINLLTAGMGNAMVGCANPVNRPATRADTAVFLSHNLRPVTLAEASVGTNSIVGQTFNAISCPAAAMGVSGGHREWFRFNFDGTISLGDDATTSPAQALPAADFAAMLTREGLVSPGTHNRGQIYELTINGNRMFFILMHTTENGVHDVGLWIPGSERPNGGGGALTPAAAELSLTV